MYVGDFCSEKPSVVIEISQRGQGVSGLSSGNSIIAKVFCRKRERGEGSWGENEDGCGGIRYL